MILLLQLISTTISSDKSKAVKFAINNNSLTLTVINPDAGTAVEKFMLVMKR